MTDLERYYAAKEAYYNGESIMPDLEFDELERSLGLENKSEIGARHNPSYTVQHPFIMGSLSKIQIKENQNGNVIWNDYFTELRRYIKDSNIPCIISPKYDGCSFEAVVIKNSNGVINYMSDSDINILDYFDPTGQAENQSVYAARFFYVRFAENGEVQTVNTEHFETLSVETAEELAKKAIESDKEIAYINSSFKYIIGRV